MDISINGAEKSGYPVENKMNLSPYFTVMDGLTQQA